MRKEITPTRTKSLRLTLDEWKAVQAAADAAHMSTHGWIRAVVTVALGNSELPNQIERLIPGAVIMVPPPAANIDIPTCVCGSTMALNGEFDGREVWICPGCGVTQDKERRTG